MKKLFTKLIGVSMLATGVACPLALDAKTVYFDTNGCALGANDVVTVHQWTDNGASYTTWNTEGTKGTKVGSRVWKIEINDNADHVIFCKNSLADSNKLSATNYAVQDGYMYSVKQSSGIQYGLKIHANADGVDWNSGMNLTQDSSNPSVFTGKINMAGASYFHFSHGGSTSSNFTVYAPSNSHTDIPANIEQQLSCDGTGNWHIDTGEYNVKVDLASNTFIFSGEVDPVDPVDPDKLPERLFLETNWNAAKIKGLLMSLPITVTVLSLL